MALESCTLYMWWEPPLQYVAKDRATPAYTFASSGWTTPTVPSPAYSSIPCDGPDAHGADMQVARGAQLINKNFVLRQGSSLPDSGCKQ